ncbi:MAG: glycosyltransferase, partial [Patescibacteria group bacterium]
ITKNRLLHMGIEEQRIKEFGIPSAPGFLKIQDREQIAKKLGIEAKKFTMLVMTGSFGVGPLEEIAGSLCADAQVLVVCGRNKTLFKRLEKKNLSNVLAFGFINNPEELMAVSDVIITKPGGLSIAELLNMELFPIFILFYLPLFLIQFLEC